MNERRSSMGDRRFGFGRRMVEDRRSKTVAVAVERRSGQDRRSLDDRRELFDRRASVKRLTRDPRA